MRSVWGKPGEWREGGGERREGKVLFAPSRELRELIHVPWVH